MSGWIISKAKNEYTGMIQQSIGNKVKPTGSNGNLEAVTEDSASMTANQHIVKLVQNII